MKLRLCGAVAAVAIMVLSCGNPLMLKQDTKPEIKAVPDKALLVIFRGTRFSSGTALNNFLDGKFIGYTLGKTYFLTTVDPGLHYVIGEGENRACARFNFEAGKVYYLLQVIYPGALQILVSTSAKGRTGFEPKNPEEAQKDINDCDYLLYEPKNGTEELKPDDYKETVDDFEKEAKETPDKHKNILEYKGY